MPPFLPSPAAPHPIVDGTGTFHEHPPPGGEDTSHCAALGLSIRAPPASRTSSMLPGKHNPNLPLT